MHEIMITSNHGRNCDLGENHEISSTVTTGPDSDRFRGSHRHGRRSTGKRSNAAARKNSAAFLWRLPAAVSADLPASATVAAKKIEALGRKTIQSSTIGLTFPLVAARGSALC
jgi:hypothetical protein